MTGFWMLRTLICHGIILQLHNINGIINPFVPNAPFLHAQKETSSGVEKGCIGNKWVKLDRKLFALNHHFKLMKQDLQVFCTKSILKSVGNLPGKNLWPCAFLVKLQAIKQILFHHRLTSSIDTDSFQKASWLLPISFDCKKFESSGYVNVTIQIYINRSYSHKLWLFFVLTWKGKCLRVTICFTNFLILQLSLYLGIRLGCTSE